MILSASKSLYEDFKKKKKFSVTGERAGVHLRLHIPRGGAAHLRRRRLRGGETAEQAQETFEDETGGDQVGQQVQRRDGGENVREGVAARQSPSPGQSEVRSPGRDAHGGPEGREAEVSEVRRQRHNHRRGISGNRSHVT